ncbi:MAG: iron-sulfur cluster assembly accessory protein [Planctomycetota bacterium]|nr:iron-sulfur cluster assembly accessory protein [Planctomycetota bacterium]
MILTQKAADELHRVLNEQKATLPANPVVRIRLAAGGCSGFEYGLGIDDSARVDTQADEVSEQFGVHMVVDKKSSLYLAGTVMDYYESLEKRGFTFENPNATKSCGCGSSFSV